MTYLPAMGHAHIHLAYNGLAYKANVVHNGK